ncbi:carboxypeptidase-like regulatory domain-containing protein [Methanoculleus chikugoensis]|uniref:carboxypeptidase-like regulatory domain-containing protein n=1 Tax=Methanoculleus chikugoensis TaxID=118126 RepID=UPI001FB3C6C1|nr:carboxypeptidase-like regulatory domain-containing protein [Methanoculleus chikugoensis]
MREPARVRLLGPGLHGGGEHDNRHGNGQLWAPGREDRERDRPYRSPAAPPAIAVSGRVTNAGGNPVPGALVRFESVFTLDDEPIAATNVTGEDGGYLVEGVFGYRQTVTVEKEGYAPPSGRSSSLKT